jgi:hypothetical protein
MLPMGRRVQEKLESLIDKHMYNLGSSTLPHFIKSDKIRCIESLTVVDILTGFVAAKWPS